MIPNPPRTLSVRPYDLGFGGLVSQEAYLRWTSDALQTAIEACIGTERLLDGFTMPMVVETSMKQREPLRALDRPEIVAGFERLGATRFVFVARITLHGIPIAEIRHRGLFVDTVSNAPTRAPERLREIHTPVYA